MKISLTKIRYVGVNWVNLTQDNAQWRAVLNTAMNVLEGK
jgi:hypothetical protein